jgi:CheY-like chemotaxis protein
MGTYKQALIAILITLGLLSWGAVQHSALTKNIYKNTQSLDELSVHLSQNLIELRLLYHQLKNEMLTQDGTNAKLWTAKDSNYHSELQKAVELLLNEKNNYHLEGLYVHLNNRSLPFLDSLKLANSAEDIVQIQTRLDGELVYLNDQISALFNVVQSQIQVIDTEAKEAHQSIKINYLVVLLSFFIFLAFILKVGLKVMNLQHQTKGLFMDMKQPISFRGNDEMSNLAISLEKMRQEVVHRRVLLQEERQQYKKHLKVRDESITHLGLQIRNSLSSIIGTLSMFNKMNLSKREQGWIRVIMSSSNHLQDQVFNLLNYSILEPDEKVLEHKNFHLNIILNQIAQDLEVTAHQKKLKLNSKPLDHQVYLNGDPWRLRQIIMKLCGYTIKYTDEGVILLGSQITKIDSNKTRFMMSINAPGVALTSQKMNDVQAWLENPDIFALDHKDEALLDLIIIGRMIELLKGEIETKQHLDGLNSFEISIPFDTCESSDLVAPINSTPALQHIVHPNQKIDPSKKNILIVDDNPLNIQMVSSMLEMMELDCDSANNGKEAIEKFGDGLEKKFDLILMDCLMPVMNGYEATTSIRDLEKGFHTPIIAVTAKSNKYEREECLSYGMDDHLSKPYKMEDLKNMIQKFI